MEYNQEPNYYDESFGFDPEMLNLMQCPISKEVMKDPVILPETAMTFERKNIEAWRKKSNKCPLTNKVLTIKLLVPNITLRELIESVHKKLPEYIRENLNDPIDLEHRFKELEEKFEGKGEDINKMNDEFLKLMDVTQDSISKSYEAKISAYEKTIKDLKLLVQELKESMADCICKKQSNAPMTNLNAISSNKIVLNNNISNQNKKNLSFNQSKQKLTRFYSFEELKKISNEPEFKDFIDLDYLASRQGKKFLSRLGGFDYVNGKELSFCHNRQSLGDQFLKLLIICDFKQLTTLDLQCNNISDKGIEYLSKCDFKQLTTLSLYNNNISDKGIEYLSKCDFKQLTTLGLSYNNISEKGIEYLSKCDFKQLTTLGLSDNNIVYQRSIDMVRKSFLNLKNLIYDKDKITK